MILMPALIKWIQQDSKATVRDQKRTVAHNLAEAGVDRAIWKLKSSTSVFAAAASGVVVAGYNFDVSYGDIAGGKYRIRLSTGSTNREVTILAEGKDTADSSVRAIRAVYRNQSVPGALMSGGIVTWANAFSAHWGPVLSHSNINITDANAAQDYFPRKYSRQVVQSTIGSYQRDTNGMALPNSDNVEWWSDYPVPEFPILDFAALRSSAAVTGTLNVYGCSKMTTGIVGSPWWGGFNCNVGGSNHNGLNHMQNTWNHPSARKRYVWYWDNDLVITGDTGNRGNGVWGTMIARKNLTNYAHDNYTYTGDVPDSAYQEYAKISLTTGDTSATNQYPADNGYQKNRPTFNFGGETWTDGKTPPAAADTDIGFRGLVYIGGNFDIQEAADVHGAVWVVGTVSKALGAERTLIFYDEEIDLPSLNVVLVRKSWNEIAPSAIAWP
jgi:hypothetical protein